MRQLLFLIFSCHSLVYQVCQCAKSICYVGESPQKNESCSNRNQILNHAIDKFGKKSDILRDPFLTIIPSLVVNGTNHAQCKKRKGKIKTGSAKSLVDFSCPYRYVNNPFHRMFDCFIGLIDVYTTANESIHNRTLDTILLIPENSIIRDLLKLVSPDPVNYNFKTIKKSDCIIASEKAIVTYASSTVLWIDYYNFLLIPQSHPFYMNMIANTQKFLNIIQLYRDRTIFGKRVPSILYINRQGDRQLTNIEIVCKKIVKFFPHLRGEIYWGTENLQETIKKFYEADIVIGFHGAGLVNVMFCKGNVLVVEISLLLHDVPEDGKSQLELKHIWRSNIVIGMLHGQLHWITFAMQLDEKLRKSNPKHLKKLTLEEKEVHCLSNFIKRKFEYTSTGDLVNLNNMSYTWDIISQDHHSNYSHAAIPGQYYSSKSNSSFTDDNNDDDDDDDDYDSSSSNNNINNNNSNTAPSELIISPNVSELIIPANSSSNFLLNASIIKSSI